MEGGSVKNRASLFTFLPRKNLTQPELQECLYFLSNNIIAIAAYVSNKPKIIPEHKMRQFHWIRLRPSDVCNYVAIQLSSV